MKFKTSLSALAFASVLVACGGSPGGGSDSTSSTGGAVSDIAVTDADVRSYLRTAQSGHTVDTYDYYTSTSTYGNSHVSGGYYAGSGGTVYSYRWGTSNGANTYPNANSGYSATTTIHVWGLGASGVNATTVNAALDEIVSNTTVNGTPLITFVRHSEDPSSSVSNAPNPVRGIWIRNDSSVTSANSCIGNTYDKYKTARGDYTITVEPVSLDGVFAPDNANSSYTSGWNNLSTVEPGNEYVHTVFIGFGVGCSDEKHLVVHEMGHALGLTAHFNGFGAGPTCTTGAICMTPFYRTLRTLYGNAPHTDVSSINVIQ